MSTTKKQKQQNIRDELARLSRAYIVEVPTVAFDQKKTQYALDTATIELDRRVYNKIGRTLIYHEFAHHICYTAHGKDSNHTRLFWRTLHEIVTRYKVNYPWHTEYKGGVTYYERYVIPFLPARKKARAINALYKSERLSTAA